MNIFLFGKQISMTNNVFWGSDLISPLLGFLFIFMTEMWKERMFQLL